MREFCFENFVEPSTHEFLSRRFLRSRHKLSSETNLRPSTPEIVLATGEIMPKMAEHPTARMNATKILSIPSWSTAPARQIRIGSLMLTVLLNGANAWALKPTDRFGLLELEAEPNMTPGHFADLFENFAFDYYPYVQPPDVFLEHRSGDCDDYAVLANHILGRCGFKTRLIRVDLVGSRVSHAVCYVTERKVYLDYNNRKYTFNLESSNPSIRKIAAKVAAALDNNWTTASEYTYTYEVGRNQTIWTVVKTDPPESDPDRNPAPPPH